MQSSISAPVYFASGSNRVADIRGFSAIGHAIGVAVPELTENAIVALEALRGRSIPVFVDSGAFSEMAFGPTGPVVVRPISDVEWAERIALYGRLAAALTSSVYLVAPDMIGNQEETLRRLALFATELKALRATGANILVPIQKGNRSQAEFAADVAKTIGFSDFVHALPCKKNATTMVELAAYVAAVKPSAVHLLGLGVKNAKAAEAFAILKDVASVSCDSNMIAANVGRGGKKPRALTAARDIAAKMIAGGQKGYSSIQELGIILAFGGERVSLELLAA